VSLLGINFHSISSAKLYQQWKSHLHVVMKKIENFPEKSELPKFILLVKFNWLIFFCGFWGGNEKFAEIRPVLLSRLVASLLDSALQREPACRLCSTCLCIHVYASVLNLFLLEIFETSLIYIFLFVNIK